MSQENVEVVRATFDAWNAGRMDVIREFYDPDIVVRTGENWLEPGPFVGREAVMRQFNQLRETFESDSLELVSDFVDIGDRVAVRWEWRPSGRGPQINPAWTTVYTVRNGKILDIHYFEDHAEALEAIGLKEQAISQENVEIVRAVYEAMSRGDLDAAFETAEPHFELVPPNQSPDNAPVRGVQEARAWLADQQETVGDLSIEVEKLITAEEFIVAFIRLRIRPHGSDADFELRIAHLWAMRGGKLIRCEVFPKREDALEAAGLSE